MNKHEQPYAMYDPAANGWQMTGTLSLWQEAEDMEAVPPAGMTRQGVLFLRAAWQPIAALAEETWPTPRAAQGESRNHTIWLRPANKPQNLENAVARRNPSTIGSKLNPSWVEWLMGFPADWTDLQETDNKTGDNNHATA